MVISRHKILDGKMMDKKTVFSGVWELEDFVGLREDTVLTAGVDCIASISAQSDLLVQAKSLTPLRSMGIMYRVSDSSFFSRPIS